MNHEADAWVGSAVEFPLQETLLQAGEAIVGVIFHCERIRG